MEDDPCFGINNALVPRTVSRTIMDLGRVESTRKWIQIWSHHIVGMAKLYFRALPLRSALIVGTSFRGDCFSRMYHSVIPHGRSSSVGDHLHDPLVFRGRYHFVLPCSLTQLTSTMHMNITCIILLHSVQLLSEHWHNSLIQRYSDGMRPTFSLPHKPFGLPLWPILSVMSWVYPDFMGKYKAFPYGGHMCTISL